MAKKMRNYKQYDARWGSKGYPRKPYNMSSSGCGPTSCAQLIQMLPKHRKLTPKSTRKYMIKHGYAIYGQGTSWSGITACLEHYGYDAREVDSMSEWLKDVAKPNHRGILLFKAGTRGGVTWTMGGHFVAVSDVKVKNGKHYVHCHDCGQRRHIGWYCYETQMRGLVRIAYAAKPKAKKKTTTKKKKRK